MKKVTNEHEMKTYDLYYSSNEDKYFNQKLGSLTCSHGDFRSTSEYKTLKTLLTRGEIFSFSFVWYEEGAELRYQTQR